MPSEDYVLPKDAFLDADVVAAYRFRPPYPDEIIEPLASLAGADGVVVDLGCGTGDISRPLAPHVRHIDAVDPSAAMLEAAVGRPGGQAANIAWHRSTAEAFVYPPCTLIFAAESIHWMDLDAVFTRSRPALGAGAFAVASREYDTPWDAQLRELIPRYSATKDFVRFDPASLGAPGRLDIRDVVTTPWTSVRQAVDEYVELQHSSAGCARRRMGADDAREFDRALVEMLKPYASDGVIEYATAATLRWGRVQPRA